MRFALLVLPAFAAGATVPAVARGQGARVSTLAAEAELLAEPGGRTVALLRPGAQLSPGERRAGMMAVVVDGFVDTSAVRSASGTWSLIVKAERGAHLRATATAGSRVVAELPRGMGLTLVARRGAWAEVRRAGWVSAARLGAAPAPAVARTVTPPAPAPRAVTVAPRVDSAAAVASEPPPEGALTARRATVLREAPENGRTVASVGPSGGVMVPVARDRGWVKVRMEGWVRESDLVPADSTLRSPLSAADLRADPEGTKGRLVRWDVEFLALRTADPLRRELADGEPYILARGPGSESSLLYLALPASLVQEAGSLNALARLTITARVRTGRSDPVGVPVLDVLTLSSR